jgi:hypothetical protein
VRSALASAPGDVAAVFVGGCSYPYSGRTVEPTREFVKGKSGQYSHSHTHTHTHSLTHAHTRTHTTLQVCATPPQLLRRCWWWTRSAPTSGRVSQHSYLLLLLLPVPVHCWAAGLRRGAQTCLPPTCMPCAKLWRTGTQSG